MLMLRRGRPSHIVGSIIDADLTLELVPERSQPRGAREPWRPAVEVFELSDALIARVEIAGLASGSVEVTVDRGELRVRGERNSSPCDDRRRFHESRIRYGPFLAVVHIPFPVDERAASADYEDGLLTIRLPRLSQSRIAASDVDRPAERT